jgi:hypothetical protein
MGSWNSTLAQSGARIGHPAFNLVEAAEPAAGILRLRSDDRFAIFTAALSMTECHHPDI